MAGRIRTVKPEWLDDEKLAGLDPDSRVLSIAVLLLADDYGRGRAGALYLAGQVWAQQPDSVDGAAVARQALANLARLGYLSLYESGGQQYYAVNNWSKHQRVDKPGKPRVPLPESFATNSRPIRALPPIPTSDLRPPTVIPPTSTYDPAAAEEDGWIVSVERGGEIYANGNRWIPNQWAKTAPFLEAIGLYAKQTDVANASQVWAAIASVRPGGEAALLADFKARWSTQRKESDFVRELSAVPRFAAYLVGRRWEDDPEGRARAATGETRKHGDPDGQGGIVVTTEGIAAQEAAERAKQNTPESIAIRDAARAKYRTDCEAREKAAAEAEAAKRAAKGAASV